MVWMCGSSGFDELRATAGALPEDGRPDKGIAVARVLAKELPPLESTLKKVIKEAVARAGTEVLTHPDLKSTVKDVAKKAVAEAVRELGRGQDEP
jgi:hypothetical protein